MPRTFPHPRLGPSLWDQRCLQAALYALRACGVGACLVRHVAPPGWEHIGLAGDHVWAAATQPAAGLLRLDRSDWSQSAIRTIDPARIWAPVIIDECDQRRCI